MCCAVLCCAVLHCAVCRADEATKAKLAEMKEIKTLTQKLEDVATLHEQNRAKVCPSGLCLSLSPSPYLSFLFTHLHRSLLL